MINLFGHGFIGSHYAKIYPCIVNERNDLTPKSNQILYTISTVDNHTFKENPFVDIETNLTTLIRVLEMCKNNSTTFNFVSSWFVYGSNIFADEESPCNPKGFYSITKRTAEQLLIEYCKEFDIKYRILRLANVLGAGDKKASEKKNALSYLIKKIKNNEEIVLQNNGLFSRNYIHVSDVCDAINLVMTKGKLNTIYNIGAHTSLFKNAIDYVIDKTGSTSEVKSVKGDSILSFGMNCSKLFNLSFIPKYSMYDILDELIDEHD